MTESTGLSSMGVASMGVASMGLRGAAGAKPEWPDGCKGVTFFKRGNKVEDMIACLDETKILFGVVKTGSGDDAGSFSRKSTVFVCYKGEGVSMVKSAKFMARKLPTQNFCDRYCKSSTQITCEDKDNMYDQVKAAIRASSVNDSKDIGGHKFKLGDTKGDRKGGFCPCEKFEVDLSAGEFGTCVCGQKKARHSPEAIEAGAPKMSFEKGYTAQPELPREKSPPRAVAVEPEPVQEEVAAPEPEVEQKEEEASYKRRSTLLRRRSSLKLYLTEYARCAPNFPEPKTVIQIVRDTYGTPFNWVLLKANKEKVDIEDAGGGGVVELSGLLEKSHGDKLLYGLVRVAFGLGTLRRVWWFTLRWQGEQCTGVSVIKKKRECAEFMDKLIGETSFAIDAMSPEDVMPEAVIDKLLNSCVVDGDKGDLSVKSLIDALEEEKQMIEEYHANKDRKAREAEEAAEAAKNAEAAALAAAAEAERLAKENAEKERLAKEEEERLEKERAKQAAAQEKADKEEQERLERERFRLEKEAAKFADVVPVPVGLALISESSEDGWILFEVELGNAPNALGGKR